MINLPVKQRNVCESNMRFYLTTIKLAKCGMLYNTKNWQNCEKIDFYTLLVRVKSGIAIFRNNLAKCSDITYETNLQGSSIMPGYISPDEFFYGH